MKNNRIIKNKKGEDVCKRCLNIISYSEEFDAYYCERCNLWLEEKCVDPLCEFCNVRPIRPINKSKLKREKKKIKIKKEPIEWENKNEDQ